MLKDFSEIELCGGNYRSPTRLPILDLSEGKISKVSIIYGRNGSGKSTLAKAFRKVAGEASPMIQSAVLRDSSGHELALNSAEKESIFVFDEDFIEENIRFEERGLGSIVMLGEQAEIAAQIEPATLALAKAEDEVINKQHLYDSYNDNKNQLSPKYYLNKIYAVLQQDNGWAGRDSRIRGRRQNSRVTINTYRQFLHLKPEKSRDELIVDYSKVTEELVAAQKGESKILVKVPEIPILYSNVDIATANQLIKKKIYKPELSERETYLLSLVKSGKTRDLYERVEVIRQENTTFCPYCLQKLSREYKTDIVSSIQKVLSDEVKEHQEALRSFIIEEISVDLSPFSRLASYQECLGVIESINCIIQNNNTLLQRKIDNSFDPIEESVVEITDKIQELSHLLKKLSDECEKFNHDAIDTQPIQQRLHEINDNIAYYDVIELSRQHDTQKNAMDAVKNELDCAIADRNTKKEELDSLEAKYKKIDIAIEIINNSLKYIFFSEGRLTIHREADHYSIKSNGKPVRPKDISIGERNIIALCYFFTKIMQGKNKAQVFQDQHLIVIDDPISSFDIENKVGIQSFLKYRMSQFLAGNLHSRVIITTHDLLTFFDLEKTCQELQNEWKATFQGKGTKYNLFELKNCALERFQYKNRQEYTELVKVIYEYAKGNATDYELVIGNIMRQALEAFSTFVYKKGIAEVSTDDTILNMSSMCPEQKVYFKNLMYRIVLNGGSHRDEQARSLEVEFFSLITETEKRRTAQEILCFIFLLNKPHIIAHLQGAVSDIEKWSEEIKKRSAIL